ncbi:MAG: DUF521 domain-containing protein [Oscillospiraceae bacterium]|nr:DUF521 domain-containing protein [Oscillospiraceae bacterium]
MLLTKEQQAIIDGSQGEIMSKIMSTLVAYGETFDAERMVPVTGEFGHTVISFGLGIMKPIYELYDKILADGKVSGQLFSADPRPVDKKGVPANLLQNIIFDFMYSQQGRYEEQLRRFGIMNDGAYTCTCYLPQVGNTPKRGDILSWAESSAVVYANSVLGARCNRNSGIIELMGSIVGLVPEFGLLTDDGRKADWIVELRTSKLPDAQLFGSAVGMKVLEQVPYVRGLDKYLGTELSDAACTYLKDFGAATASNGSVGLYHIENLTPEAVDYGASLIREGAPVYVVDDAEIERVKNSYPCIWKDLNAKPKLCFMGCPHMTLNQLIEWTKRVEDALAAVGNKKVVIPTVFTAAPAVLKAFEETEYAKRLERTGVRTSSICPLMYMNNPLCKSMPVITSSNKLRTYSSARFYPEAEILNKITGLEGK